jgi:hypothetical protein
MIGSLIAFVLGNFTLSFFVIGLVFSAVAITRAPKPRGATVVIEKLLSWFVFWTIGVLYLYNAVFHIFFGKMAAAFIGWADSPFQFEVGTASLGFSAVGFLAAFGGFDRRLAAILGSNLPARRRRRSRLPDDHRPQFRAGQCRHHLLERHFAALDRLPAAVARPAGGRIARDGRRRMISFAGSAGL